MSGNSSLSVDLMAQTFFAMHVMAASSILSKRGMSAIKAMPEFTLTQILHSYVHSTSLSQSGYMHHGSSLFMPSTLCLFQLHLIISMSERLVFVSYYSFFSENWGYVQSIIL